MTDKIGIHECLTLVAITYSKLNLADDLWAKGYYCPQEKTETDIELWAKNYDLPTIEHLKRLYACYRSIPLVIALGIDSRVKFVTYINSIQALPEWKFKNVSVPQDKLDEFMDCEIPIFNYKEYSIFTESTAQYNKFKKEGIAYLGLGITSEAGEIAGTLKKLFRGDYELDSSGRVTGNKLLPINVASHLITEIGDLQWYLTQLANELGYDMENILMANKSKLQQRVEESTIKQAIRD